MQVVMQQVNQFLEELYDGDFQVVFRKNSEQFYGFDAKEETAPDSWYESRTISGEDYWIPYKSVRGGLVEKVDALPLDGNSLDSIYFQQRSATPLPFTVENEVATVSFQGLPGETYYLSALKDSGADSLVDHVVGLLSVVPYEQLTPRIVLVPLSSSAANGVLASEIEQELQRIYAQAVVRPTVTLDAVFSPEGYTPPLRAVNSGLLSNYTPQMNDIIGAYEDQQGYDPNTYYLFLTDDYEATDRAGFMPRGRQFGFLYMGNTGTGEAFARTLAHEIGHGAFVLEHTFDAHPDHLPQHQTDNLMDYANGTHLYKWQWDLIHDPVGVPFLEGDGDGEMVVVDAVPCEIEYSSVPGSNKLSDWTEVRVGRGFITPSGGFARLNQTVKVVFGRKVDDNLTITNGVVSKIRIQLDEDNTEEYIAITTHERGANHVNATRWFHGYAKSIVSSLLRREYTWAENQAIIDTNGGYLELLPLLSSQDLVYAMGDMVNVDYRPIGDCYCEFLFSVSDQSVLLPHTGTASLGYHHIPYFADEIYTSCPNECDDSVNDLFGAGRQLYELLRPHVESDEEEALRELGIHFNSIRNGPSFAFYGDFLEDMGPMVSLKPDVINYFINNEIFTVEAFDSHFPHSSDFARDAETIFVKFGNEPLRSSIPPNYNEKTLDHARGGKYEYSFSDLIKREKIRTNIPMFYTGITNFESAEIAPPLSTYDAHEQYVAIFGTNSAMFAWASYFFGVASETYDPLAVGIVVRRIGTLFKPGVTAGSRFLRLANAVQKIKTKPGLTLEQIAQLDDFLLNIPQGKLKNLSSTINSGETTFVRPRGENPNQVGYYSVRQNGDQGEFVEIAYIQKEGSNYFLRVDQNHLNTPGFEDVPVGQGTHFDVGGGVQIRNNQGQYLKDVQLIRREDGLTSFTGRIDIARTRLTATNASEELIQRVSQSEYADDLSLDLVNGGSGFIATFNQSVEGLVGAWRVVKHLPDDIRLSVPSLHNISDILSSSLPRVEKINLIESRIASSAYEHGAILAPDGSLIAFRVGTPNSIDFSDLFGNVPSGYFFTHNHPGSGTFSDNDILTASGFQFSDFSAVTQSGKKYTMRRTSNSTNILEPSLIDARVTHRNQLRDEYGSQWNQTIPGSPEREALLIEINEELDRRTLNQFGFDYIIE